MVDSTALLDNPRRLFCLSSWSFMTDFRIFWHRACKDFTAGWCLHWVSLVWPFSGSRCVCELAAVDVLVVSRQGKYRTK